MRRNNSAAGCIGLLAATNLLFFTRVAAAVIDCLQAESQKVTLNLRSVPLADVLKYVTESAGLRYRVDPHAVVIYQPPPAVPAEASPSNVKSP
jgi:type II secretory pathway component GspD/PulD (secretin)